MCANIAPVSLNAAYFGRGIRAPQALASAWRTSMADSAHMVKPIRPSRIFQARGLANQGDSHRAPEPRRLNQAMLAVLARATNQPCNAGGCCAPMLPISNTVSSKRAGLAG